MLPRVRSVLIYTGVYWLHPPPDAVLYLLCSTTLPHFTGENRQAMSLPMACAEYSSQGSEQARDAEWAFKNYCFSF